MEERIKQRNRKRAEIWALKSFRDRSYIELEVDDIDRTGCLLERELGLTDFKVVTDTKIEIYDLGRSVREISAALVQNGIGFTSIGIKQNSLEDYFFHVIGEV